MPHILKTKAKQDVLVADVMLAKLARWLRLSGLQTIDVPYQEDTKILRYMRAKKRSTLLTNDRELFRRAQKRKLSALWIPNGTIDNQLSFVVKNLSLKINPGKETFCPVCSSKLKKVSKEYAISHGVLKRIAARYDDFYYCRKCGKVYWQGSHWERINKRLEGIMKKQIRRGSPRRLRPR